MYYIDLGGIETPPTDGEGIEDLPRPIHHPRTTDGMTQYPRRTSVDQLKRNGPKLGRTLMRVENEAVWTRTPETPVIKATAIETTKPMTPNQRPAIIAIELET